MVLKVFESYGSRYASMSEQDLDKYRGSPTTHLQKIMNGGPYFRRPPIGPILKLHDTATNTFKQSENCAFSKRDYSATTDLADITETVKDVSIFVFAGLFEVGKYLVGLGLLGYSVYWFK